jgi:hypothetical protein
VQPKVLEERALQQQWYQYHVGYLHLIFLFHFHTWEGSQLASNACCCVLRHCLLFVMCCVLCVVGRLLCVGMDRIDLSCLLLNKKSWLLSSFG